MPTVSERGRIMPDSTIRKLAPLAEKAKADGKKVFHLISGNTIYQLLLKRLQQLSRLTD